MRKDAFNGNPRADKTTAEMRAVAARKLHKTIELQHQIRILAARSNINDFIEYTMQDPDQNYLKQTWFHREWQELMDKNKYVAIIAARGHGKTEQVAARAIYELGKNPNCRIKIISTSKEVACARVRQIGGLITGNPRLHSVFPDLKPSDDGLTTWNTGSLTVQRTLAMRDPSLSANGIEDSSVGGRANILIFDDVIDDQNSMSEVYRDRIKKLFWGTWFPMLEPNGAVWVVSTPWHILDLVNDLLRNELFVSKSYPTDVDTLLWPERCHKQWLMDRIKGMPPREFDRAYRLKCLTDEELAFDTSKIREIDPPEYDPNIHDHHYAMISIGVDPNAATEKTTKDYFSMVAVGMCPDGSVDIIDVYRKKPLIPDHVDTVMQFYKSLQFKFPREHFQFVFEEVNYQGSLRLQVSSKVGVTPCYALKPIKDKMFRANRAINLCGRGLLKVHKGINNKQDFFSEMLYFPNGQNDDMVDALAYAINAIPESYFWGGGDIVPFTDNDKSKEEEYDDLPKESILDVAKQKDAMFGGSWSRYFGFTRSNNPFRSNN